MMITLDKVLVHVIYVVLSFICLQMLVNLSFLHQLQRMCDINKDCNAICYFKPTVSHG